MPSSSNSHHRKQLFFISAAVSCQAVQTLTRQNSCSLFQRQYHAKQFKLSPDKTAVPYFSGSIMPSTSNSHHRKQLFLISAAVSCRAVQTLTIENSCSLFQRQYHAKQFKLSPDKKYVLLIYEVQQVNILSVEEVRKSIYLTCLKYRRIYIIY